jgi:hypothetical protein
MVEVARPRSPTIRRALSERYSSPSFFAYRTGFSFVSGAVILIVKRKDIFLCQGCHHCPLSDRSVSAFQGGRRFSASHCERFSRAVNGSRTLGANDIEALLCGRDDFKPSPLGPAGIEWRLRRVFQRELYRLGIVDAGDFRHHRERHVDAGGIALLLAKRYPVVFAGL